MEVENQLAGMGLTVSEPNPSIGNFVPAVRVGNLLFVSGNLPRLEDGSMVATGKLGRDVSIEEGYEAARQCAVNCLASARSIIGDLDKVQRVAKLLVMSPEIPNSISSRRWETAPPTCWWNSTAKAAATPDPLWAWPPCRAARPSKSK